MAEINPIARNGSQSVFISSRCSMTLTPAGTKKNAIFFKSSEEKLSMSFSFMIFKKRSAKSSSIAIIADGKEKGRIRLINSAKRQIEKIIAISTKIFISAFLSQRHSLLKIVLSFIFAYFAGSLGFLIKITLRVASIFDKIYFAGS